MGYVLIYYKLCMLRDIARVVTPVGYVLIYYKLCMLRDIASQMLVLMVSVGHQNSYVFEVAQVSMLHAQHSALNL